MIENEYLIAESLDIEFEYPEDYKKFLKEMQVLDETSWWFLGSNKGLSKTWYEVLNLDYKSMFHFQILVKCLIIVNNLIVNIIKILTINRSLDKTLIKM